VRKSTVFVTTVVAASALLISWRAGELLTPEPIDLGALGSSASPTPETPAGTESPTPVSSTDPSTAPTGDSSTTPTPTPTKTVKPAKPKSVTLSSDPITYKYGVVQVSLTKVGEEITDVTMLQGDATNGRAEAYVTLIGATLQTQGINYGNVSGATFTTDAFKKAISNVLKKF
jgi:uncharacterized protein with FMN-binding domain